MDISDALAGLYSSVTGQSIAVDPITTQGNKSALTFSNPSETNCYTLPRYSYTVQFSDTSTVQKLQKYKMVDPIDFELASWGNFCIFAPIFPGHFVIGGLGSNNNAQNQPTWYEVWRYSLDNGTTWISPAGHVTFAFLEVYEGKMRWCLYQITKSGKFIYLHDGVPLDANSIVEFHTYSANESTSNWIAFCFKNSYAVGVIENRANTIIMNSPTRIEVTDGQVTQCHTLGLNLQSGNSGQWIVPANAYYESLERASSGVAISVTTPSHTYVPYFNSVGPSFNLN